LNPGSSCSVSVHFVPVANGAGSLTSTAHITLQGNDTATLNVNSPNFNGN
jgi:hypothetical protein